MAQKQSFHGLECLAIKLLIMRSEGLNNMLHYAWVFLVVALIAAFLGFGGVAGTAAGIAKILFVIFLVMFLVSFITGRRSV